jgi:hypothetical protein
MRSLIFLALGMFFGLIYSINLLGYSIDTPTLDPYNMRSLHISLMLYGFITLMLSMLPFLLINKEVGSSKEGLHYLNLFFIFWYIFLVYMVVSLLFGNHRGLAFYDFTYVLNFILALAGLFYAIALYKFIQLYTKIPMWVKVSFRVVLISPFALLILMNPVIGQVERTVSGPHGDNTLGMSLALIPLYYLIIKLLNKENFIARWNILWIIPTVFYFGSVLYRTFVASLTYNEEWFLQYLALLYIPILYRWYKDSDIEGFSRKALLTSIVAFLSVDVEGNILFTPSIRWVFHRNDLVVAHSHVALGIGVFFMVIAMFSQHIQVLSKKSFYNLFIGGLLGIFVVLTLSGFVETGMLSGMTTDTLWKFRTLFGFVVLASLVPLVQWKISYTKLELYNLFGLFNDGIGGILLILLAAYIYPLLGFYFDGKYAYVVFAFVSMTGLIHYLAIQYKKYEQILTMLSAIIRVFVSSVFFSLYMHKTMGIEAIVIAGFDFFFASIYFIYFHKEVKI